MTLTFRRRHVGLTERHERGGREDSVDASAQRHLARTCHDASRAELHRHETGGACAVDRHRLTVKIEEIGEAVCEHTACATYNTTPHSGRNTSKIQRSLKRCKILKHTSVYSNV